MIIVFLGYLFDDFGFINFGVGDKCIVVVLVD